MAVAAGRGLIVALKGQRAVYGRLFSGRDANADFRFRTEAAATRAPQALVDMVFMSGSSGPRARQASPRTTWR